MTDAKGKSMLKIFNGSTPTVAAIVFAAGALWWQVDSLSDQMQANNTLQLLTLERLAKVEERQLAIQSRVESHVAWGEGKERTIDDRIRQLERTVRP